jgi:hypothetical protein
MNKYIQLIYGLSLGLLTLVISSCAAPPHDLDTPCPDYGRQCSQALINL